MKTYIVTGVVVTLHAGKVKLTSHQASLRLYALKKISDDVYEITGATQFKKGEIFEWDGELPKSMADQVEMEDPKPAPTAEESAEAEIHKTHAEPHHGKNKKK